MNLILLALTVLLSLGNPHAGGTAGTGTPVTAAPSPTPPPVSMDGLAAGGPS